MGGGSSSKPKKEEVFDLPKPPPKPVTPLDYEKGLSDVAAGKMKTPHCPKCGQTLKQQQASGVAVMRCPDCMITVHVDENGNVRHGSKGKHHQQDHSHDRADSVSRNGSKQSLARSNSRQQSKATTASSHDSEPQEGERKSSKDRRMSRRVTVGGGLGEEQGRRNGSKQAIAQSSDPMHGLHAGDRVIFEEYSTTAEEYGIGTVIGPTEFDGTVLVKFDKRLDHAPFKLKADALHKLEAAEERALVCHKGQKRRSSMKA